MTALEAFLAIVTALGGGSAIGAWLMKLWQQRHEQVREDRADARTAAKEDRKEAWDRQAEIITRLDRQVELLQAEQRRSLVAEMACREQVARLMAQNQWLADLVHGLHADLVKAGLNPDPLPKFVAASPQPQMATVAEKEFIQRSAEHGTNLVRKEAEDSRHPPEDPQI